jgi:hypothetical protein
MHRCCSKMYTFCCLKFTMIQETKGFHKKMFSFLPLSCVLLNWHHTNLVGLVHAMCSNGPLHRVHFFASYANNVPRFCNYMSGCTGIPFLIWVIKLVKAGTMSGNSHIAVWDLCETLVHLSTFHLWQVHSYSRQKVCNNGSWDTGWG